jgi:hypothetical protein
VNAGVAEAHAAARCAGAAVAEAHAAAIGATAAVIQVRAAASCVHAAVVRAHAGAIGAGRDGRRVAVHPMTIFPSSNPQVTPDHENSWSIGGESGIGAGLVL